MHSEGALEVHSNANNISATTPFGMKDHRKRQLCEHLELEN